MENQRFFSFRFQCILLNFWKITEISHDVNRVHAIYRIESISVRKFNLFSFGCLVIMWYLWMNYDIQIEYETIEPE